MSGNDAFQLVGERGWRRGLGNMLDSEFGGWFKTRMWWVQVLIWAGMVGFILVGGLFASSERMDLETATLLYALFGGVFPAVAVVIVMQDALVGEKQSGTASWIMSKPVSREAFILSKLVADSVGVLVTMILPPGILAYALLSYAAGHALNPVAFVLAMLVMWICLEYFLSLALMLGALFNNRGPVIGICLALLFLQQNLIGLIKPLQYVLPWTIAVPLNNSNQGSLVSALITGQPLPSLIPLIAVIVQIIVFNGIALWRFRKEEF